MIHRYDALILGGGAAGLMCAIEAGKRGRRVAVLERAERLGKKVLVSGGGRCNFTNIHCSAANFISANPHFAKSALARFTPAEFLALVERHHIPYHEKTLGQLFCDHSAQDVLTMLEKECHESGARLFTSIAIQEVARPDQFVVKAGDNEFRAPVLVVATGGLSIPKMGATALGYDLARQFGLAIRETRPGLVPLLFGVEDGRHYTDLAGVSAEVIAACDGQSFREKMLVTHRGLSGPAILQISSYWEKTGSIVVDLAPEQGITTGLLEGVMPRNIASLRTALRSFLPNRLADRWLEIHEPRSLTNGSSNNRAFKSHSAESTAEIAIETIPGRPRFRVRRTMAFQWAATARASRPSTTSERTSRTRVAVAVSAYV